MHLNRLLPCLALCLLAGCSVAKYGRRTHIAEPNHFYYCADKRQSYASYRNAAADAWDREIAVNPAPYSEDYAFGFHVGFVDHLMYGGSGAPPILPPRKYWRLDQRDHPQGQMASHDWFAGFQYGALVAEATIGHVKVASSPPVHPPIPDFYLPPPVPAPVSEQEFIIPTAPEELFPPIPEDRDQDDAPPQPPESGSVDPAGFTGSELITTGELLGGYFLPARLDGPCKLPSCTPFQERMEW